MVNWKKIPYKHQGKSEDELLAQILEFTMGRYGFRPGRTYNLCRREPHGSVVSERVSQKYPHFMSKPGEGLMRRDEHWERHVVDAFQLPTRLFGEYVPENLTCIEDLRTVKQFNEWFEDRFSGLKDGVYGTIMRPGRHKGGYGHLFVVKYQHGEVMRFKKKSNGTERYNASSYLALPYWFYKRNKWDV